MTVLMIHDTPGVTEEAMQEFERIGLIEKLTAAPGFGGHASGPTDTGYRVVELWDSRESWRTWFEGNVAPNMPPGAPVAEPTFFDLTRVVPASRAANASTPAMDSGEHVGTWAQWISLRLQPGKSPAPLAQAVAAAEDRDSGLVRNLFFVDQDDPQRAYALAVFENEEKARAREQDPVRQERLAPMRALMSDALAAPAAFVDLTVIGQFRG